MFAFARVEGCAVVDSFTGGRLTSDAGALLLGATDRVLGLTRRLAACFRDARDPTLIEHAVDTLVMQRVVGIALGYEDLIDHDELRHDPV
ncbi:MAG TPA: transposase, partial [Rhodopila sp.]